MENKPYYTSSSGLVNIIVSLVTAFSPMLLGCRPAATNEPVPIQRNYQDRISAYFRGEYDKVNLEALTGDERRLLKSAVSPIAPEYSDFMQRNMPYVNESSKNPQNSQKAKVFINRNWCGIQLYMLYDQMMVMPENPSAKEVKNLRDRYDSGELKIPKGGLGELVQVFVDPKNMTNRDLFFLDQVVNLQKAGLLPGYNGLLDQNPVRKLFNMQ